MKIKIMISALCLTVLVCVLGEKDVYAKGVVNDGVGIRYLLENGQYATNCRRCENGFAMHFNENGYMDVWGFDALAGNWKTTQKGKKRYMFVDGRVPVGGPWLFADGKYYTFDDDGYLLKTQESLTNEQKKASTTTESSSNTYAEPVKQTQTVENTYQATNETYQATIPDTPAIERYNDSLDSLQNQLRNVANTFGSGSYSDRLNSIANKLDYRY